MWFCSLRSFEGRSPGLRGKPSFLSRSLHQRRCESLSICPSVCELRISQAVWRCEAATAASGSRCSPWRWAPDCHLQTPCPNTDYCSRVPDSASTARERQTCIEDETSEQKHWLCLEWNCCYILLHNTYWSHYAMCYVPQMASNYHHPAVVTKCHICWITYMYCISLENVKKKKKVIK